MEIKKCPECLSEIPIAAAVCSACGERIEGILCQECMALSPSRAKVCRWCNNPLVTETEKTLVLTLRGYIQSRRRIPHHLQSTPAEGVLLSRENCHHNLWIPWADLERRRNRVGKGRRLLTPVGHLLGYDIHRNPRPDLRRCDLPQSGRQQKNPRTSAGPGKVSHFRIVFQRGVGHTCPIYWPRAIPRNPQLEFTNW
jgi:ribosomal protein L40E